MFDLKWIRDNPDEFDAGLRRRGLAALSSRIVGLDGRRRAAQTRFQELQQKRNELSRQIGAGKKKGEDTGALEAEVAALKDGLAAAEAEEQAAAAEAEALLAGMPNLPAADVPDGVDETANVELRRFGNPRNFEFRPKQHFEIGEALGLMDFEQAAVISGARFVVLKGALARLERALAAFMLDLHTGEFGYSEVSPPLLVREAAVFGTGQLPKFESDLFATSFVNWERAAGWIDEAWDRHVELPIRRSAKELERLRAEGRITIEAEEDAFLKAVKAEELTRFREEIKGRFDKEAFRERFFLVPTAEVSLTNLVADTILEEERLPLRVTAHTPCFRAEAGAAGKDTRGMIRQHQFNKVELVSIAHPDHSEAEHERMTACAEEVLKRLGLPYRVIVLCTGDMGFAAQKTYDIEVWLPGQAAYREISSCSSCGEFQARRMKARMRKPGEKGTRFVHTLNGSGLAVGRTLIAVLENFQQEDGSIALPEVLWPYMGGLEVIRPQ